MLTNAALTVRLGMQGGKFDGGDCSDPSFADSHAECQGPGSPYCMSSDNYDAGCLGGGFPVGGGGGAGVSGGGGGGARPGASTMVSTGPSILGANDPFGSPISGFQSPAAVASGSSPFVIYVTAICASDPICLSVLLGGVAVGAVAATPNKGALACALLLGPCLAINAGTQIYQAKAANQRQNQQFNEALRRIQQRCGRPLTQGERRRLHDEITKQGYGLGEIVEIGVGMFCPGK